ncbi:hypothetical protein CEXT_250431 [Caerostris extrusa]|uniref:Uncharacterized protein n=1 Tax=Caerostris extrusa TaxID=172846 RepID=A0AAV4PUJ9_CAEEX|nr:hypothetical protein CEXT_250431 [Caerostris extrusa]
MIMKRSVAIVLNKVGLLGANTLPRRPTLEFSMCMGSMCSAIVEGKVFHFNLAVGTTDPLWINDNPFFYHDPDTDQFVTQHRY